MNNKEQEISVEIVNKMTEEQILSNCIRLSELVCRDRVDEAYDFLFEIVRKMELRSETIDSIFIFLMYKRYEWDPCQIDWKEIMDKRNGEKTATTIITEIHNKTNLIGIRRCLEDLIKELLTKKTYRLKGIVGRLIFNSDIEVGFGLILVHKSAKEGCAASMCMLADLILRGDRIFENNDVARKWVENAINSEELIKSE